jgi:hypothetical protein
MQGELKPRATFVEIERELRLKLQQFGCVFHEVKKKKKRKKKGRKGRSEKGQKFQHAALNNSAPLSVPTSVRGFHLMSPMPDTSESPVASAPERGGNQCNKCLESLDHLWAAVEQERRRDGHEAAAVGRSLVGRSGGWRFCKPLHQLLHNGESQGNVLSTVLYGEALDGLPK